MHPFTTFIFWLLFSTNILMLKFGLPLFCISIGIFIILLSCKATYWRWRFVAWFMLPITLVLCLVYRGEIVDELIAISFDNNLASTAITIWLRLLAIISGFQFWLQYTHTEQIIRALFASRLPINISYLLVIPFLFTEQFNQLQHQIKAVLLTRGIPINGTIIQRINALPLFVISLIRHLRNDIHIRQTALAMRGFRIIAKRTTLSPPHDPFCQKILRYSMVLFIIIEGGIWLWQ